MKEKLKKFHLGHKDGNGREWTNAKCRLLGREKKEVEIQIRL